MILGFTGKAGCGKSTIAKILKDRVDAEIVSFAGPIKEMAIEQFGWDGEKDDKGRRLLQVIGTEAGRDYNQNIWVDKLIERAEDIEEEGAEAVLIDDVRFDNEAKAIVDSGGLVFKVNGRGLDLESNSSHASEAGVNREYVTDIITNDGDIENLERQAQRIIDKYVSVDDPMSLQEGWIQMHSGHSFSFTRPEEADIELEDIAHSLSHICRFGGHTKVFRSVADHGICVANHLMRSKDTTPNTRLWGLIHDASEAYIGDIVTPLKRQLTGIKELERKIQLRIMERFSLVPDDIDEEAVKHADTVMLVSEAFQFFDEKPLHNWTEQFDVEPVDYDLFHSADHKAAKRAFLEAYVTIQKQRGVRCSL